MSAVRKIITNKLRIEDKFIDQIIVGSKVSTIRYGLIFLSDKLISFNSEERRINVILERVDYSKSFGDLTQENALNDGFQSLEELKKELKKFYPDILDSDQISIIHFKYAENLNNDN